MKAVIDSAGLNRELALRGMNFSELAAQAGVSRATISAAVAGRRVDYLTLRKLARALTITPPLPGAAGIVGSQKDAAIEPQLVAAGAGTLANAST
ncbi:MAG: helix-turn-helix transcriptional regulator [Candidatus Dormiibacterota bacterium]